MSWTGPPFSAMLGLTQSYIAPFALSLKATTAQIGLLTSIPSLMMAVSQPGTGAVPQDRRVVGG